MDLGELNEKKKNKKTNKNKILNTIDEIDNMITGEKGKVEREGPNLQFFNLDDIEASPLKSKKIHENDQEQEEDDDEEL